MRQEAGDRVLRARQRRRGAADTIRGLLLLGRHGHDSGRAGLHCAGGSNHVQHLC